MAEDSWIHGLDYKHLTIWLGLWQVRLMCSVYILLAGKCCVLMDLMTGV